MNRFKAICKEVKIDMNVKILIRNAAVLAAGFVVFADMGLTAYADGDTSATANAIVYEANATVTTAGENVSGASEAALEDNEAVPDAAETVSEGEGDPKPSEAGDGDGAAASGGSASPISSTSASPISDISTPLDTESTPIDVSQGTDAALGTESGATGDMSSSGIAVWPVPESGALAGTGSPVVVSAANAGTGSQSSMSTVSDSSISGTFGILQSEKYDNLDEDPVLDGGEVRFLANISGPIQQLSAVFRSSDGKVIVVDGGVEEDTEHLVGVIKEFGSKVDAWLITHPHMDHVGALYSILSSGRDDIEIGDVYYNFFEQEWYYENDGDDAAMAYMTREALESLDESRRHSNISMGEMVFLSDKLSFKVLNNPIKTKGIFAGNASGIMYDINIDGKHFIILGDMSAEAGDRHMRDGALNGIVCDYVQIAHHGQTGVSDEFYNALRPENCIWPTNDYIYNAKDLNLSGLGTTRTKLCISKLPVKHNYVTLDRDVIIR